MLESILDRLSMLYSCWYPPITVDVNWLQRVVCRTAVAGHGRAGVLRFI